MCVISFTSLFSFDPLSPPSRCPAVVSLPLHLRLLSPSRSGHSLAVLSLESCSPRCHEPMSSLPLPPSHRRPCNATATQRTPETPVSHFAPWSPLPHCHSLSPPCASAACELLCFSLSSTELATSPTTSTSHPHVVLVSIPHVNFVHLIHRRLRPSHGLGS